MFFAISIQVVRWVGCGKPSHLLAFGHLFCSIFLVFDKNMFDSADGALEQVASSWFQLFKSDLHVGKEFS
jgi:hypothetical protein